MTFASALPHPASEDKGCQQNSHMPLNESVLTDDLNEWGLAYVMRKVNGQSVKEPHAINRMRMLPDRFNRSLLLTFYENEATEIARVEIPFRSLRELTQGYSNVIALNDHRPAPDTGACKKVHGVIHQGWPLSVVGKGVIDRICAEQGLLLSEPMRYALFTGIAEQQSAQTAR